MKRYPLLILLIISILLVSLPGAVVSIRDMNFAYPAAAVMIQTIKNRQVERLVFPEGRGLPDRMMYHPETEEKPEQIKASGEASSGVSADEASLVRAEVKADRSHEAADTVSAAEVSENSTGSGNESISENRTEGAENTDGNAEEETEAEEVWPKEFTTVSDNYFEDACFIGDSRVQGLGLYSDLPGTNYGVVGMQLYRVFDKKAISTDAGKVTITDALAGEPKYGKIYMGFGLNEMGWGNDEMFADYYYGLIDYLKAVQPDATLYIMGLIHVTEREEQRSSLFNNEAVNHRNEILKEIADNERIYYLDLNEVFTDEYGRLAAEDSFDGIHIKASAIHKWADYLREHAIE